MSAVCAVLLALMGFLEIVAPGNPRDDASFGAGYSAASDRGLVHRAMGNPGVTPLTLCGALYDRHSARSGLVRGDFVDGCTRAVGDVME